MATTRGVIINQTRGYAARFAHSFSQRHEFFIIKELNMIHAHQLPALRSGDFIRMVRAQIPGVWVLFLHERANNGCLLAIGIGQRRYGRAAAARAGTTTNLSHANKSKP